MAAKTVVDIGRLIVSKPGLHSGRPCLAGTGMTVHAVAGRYLAGLSAEQILDDVSDVDLARIHAALAYYHANKQRIDADLEADRRLYDGLAAKYAAGWTRDTHPR
jgi:uncharacterized protein (DUF433 family)